MFRRLFDDFLSSDLAARASRLGDEFFKFCKAGGAQLRSHAVFEALHAARTRADGHFSLWRAWPVSLRAPHSGKVKQFAHDNEKEVQFHCFLQWVADRSLATAQQASKDAGMRIGLISDLAVGMSGEGSHAWSNQYDVLNGLQIGAPPDLYNQNGQNWGLTTFSPWALRTGGFAPFIATLRAALRHAGGVRIDHVMGLMRLWVIPDGAGPQDGTYLAYPLDDLLRLTALESLRHRAIVIGEDLGTVPAGFRETLSRVGIYGMQVLWFERAKRRFLPPQNWSASAAAMTSTHDLPTVAGWWRGHDIETRRELDLVADPDEEIKMRQADRKTLWRSFVRAKAASGEMPAPGEPGRAVDAALEFVAQTPSQLALIPLEDALALEEQPNLPGTIDEHPNWRRRYSRQSRSTARFCPGREASGTPDAAKHTMSAPRATMRQQFHSGFTFAQAAALAPYFASLGISHVYASPIMMARPGSLHGYDTIDPTRVNPELGGEDGLRALVRELRRHDLGLIVDIVPNHMAIGNGNAWWMDVLARGRDSRYAKYFDIDWTPADPHLHGKVLLPILGRPYGEALSAGEIKLGTSEAGQSVVRYFDHEFPVAPDRAGVDPGSLSEFAAELGGWPRAASSTSGTAALPARLVAMRQR